MYLLNSLNDLLDEFRVYCLRFLNFLVDRSNVKSFDKSIYFFMLLFSYYLFYLF